MSDQEELQDSITNPIVDLGAACTHAPVAAQIPQSEDDTKPIESTTGVHSSQVRREEINVSGSENPLLIIADIRSLQSVVMGAGATQSFQISDKAVFESIPGQSCKDLYSKDEIIQAGRELYEKYGCLDFTGLELAHLINKKQAVKEKLAVVKTYVSLVTDSGHKEDGGHVIELSYCDKCASQGEQPVVKWVH